jgi:hypothetical protein
VARKPSRVARSTTHSCATTTPRVRRAIQASEETNIVLAKRHGVNRKTIAKWKAREFISDERMGPKNPRSSLLTPLDEAVILAYRWHTRLALDDAHFRLKRLMPKLSRSTLYRCLKRYGLSRIGSTKTCPPLTTAALRGPYIFEIRTHEVAFRGPDDSIGVLYSVFLAVEEITKDVYAEVSAATPENAAAFLVNLVAQSPERSLRSAPKCIRRSPTGERVSTKTWRRSVLIRSRSPAAPVGSSTLGRSHPTRSPLKSAPQASKSDSGAGPSNRPVGLH